MGMFIEKSAMRKAIKSSLKREEDQVDIKWDCGNDINDDNYYHVVILLINSL